MKKQVHQVNAKECSPCTELKGQPPLARRQPAAAAEERPHLTVIPGSHGDVVETSLCGKDKKVESLHVPTQIAMEEHGFVVVSQIDNGIERVAPKKT